MAETAVLMRSKRAQAALEYAVIIICVVSALLAMRVYIRRGMQGRLRQSADELGQQYAPRHTSGAHNLTYSSISTIESKTQSEARLGFDLDEDGTREDEVYGTTTNNTIHSALTQEEGKEAIDAGAGT